MSDRIMSLKQSDGTSFGNEIPLGAKAENIDVTTSTSIKSLQEVLGENIGGGESIESRLSAAESKLSGIQEGANKTTVDSSLSNTSTNPVQNKIVTENFNNYLSLAGGTLAGNLFLTPNAAPENSAGLPTLLGLFPQSSKFVMEYAKSEDVTVGKAKSADTATTADNATKVNSHTVNSDVPANAKFTDTTYSAATSSSNGLMTSDMYNRYTNSIISGGNGVTEAQGNVNFNNLLQCGSVIFSAAAASTATNIPDRMAGRLFVYNLLGSTQLTQSDSQPWRYIVQVYWTFSEEVYQRHIRTDGSGNKSYGSWTKVLNTRDYHSNYIVAAGATTQWTWYKFSNGYAVCYRRAYSEGKNANSAWGSVFTTGVDSIGSVAYPFTFKDAPVELISIVGGPGKYSGWLITSSTSNTTTKTATYEFARATSSWIDGNLCYVVFGQYA